MMRIALANYSSALSQKLTQLLASISDYQLIWSSQDGKETVTLCNHNRPDLLLITIEMPGLDGVQVTEMIMKQSPCAILLITENETKDAGKVFTAMGYGAKDIVNLNREDGEEQLLKKVHTIAKLLGKNKPKSLIKTIPQSPEISVSTISRKTPLIAIGSSTGGPQVLAHLLMGLPEDFNASIVIIQHIDAQFSEGLAVWLNEQTPLTVRLAVAGDRPTPKTVLIAGTNDHLFLKFNQSLDYTKDPIKYPYRPSVDVFFKSLAKHWMRPDIAILLTGMGRDGAEGLKELRDQGWHTISQDRSSCAVYGMPKAAEELSASVQVLSPAEIVKVLLQKVK